MSKEQFEAEKKQVAEYKPPTPHKVKFKMRIAAVERWIEGQGLVTADNVVSHIMTRYHLERPQALEYFAEVKKAFEKAGRVYGK